VYVLAGTRTAHFLYPGGGAPVTSPLRPQPHHVLAYATMLVDVVPAVLPPPDPRYLQLTEAEVPAGPGAAPGYDPQVTTRLPLPVPQPGFLTSGPRVVRSCRSSSRVALALYSHSPGPLCPTPHPVGSLVEGPLRIFFTGTTVGTDGMSSYYVSTYTA
jgi:hypothetical protein